MIVKDWGETSRYQSWTETDSWDAEIARDSQPGGRMRRILDRVRRDIAEGTTKPLDEVIDNK